MATNSWIGPTTGQGNLWDRATNWSKGLPVSSSDVVITAAGTYAVNITAADLPYQIKSLQLGTSSGSIRLFDNGSLSITGTTNLTHSTLDVGGTGTADMVGGAAIDNFSTLDAEGVINVTGALSGTGGTVDIDGGALYADSLAGSNNYTISLDGTLDVGSSITPTSSITFSDSGPNTLLLQGSATSTSALLSAPIRGFEGQNKIDIASLQFNDNYSTSYSGTTLRIISGGVLAFTITNIDNPGAFLLSDDGGGGTVISPTCYAKGTRLATPDGEVPVEALQPGSYILSLVDGDLMPAKVVWVGRRHLDLTTHPRPEMVAPVCIERGAFDDDVPHRKLLLSPDHAVFVDGKLICCRQLLNGTTIRQETAGPSVEYLHVELETHAILLAEGLPAESYLDTGNRGFFANANAPFVLYPDLTDETDYPTRQAGSCAPFVWDEANVRPVWERLADRAAAIGLPLPERDVLTDASPRLRVKGHKRFDGRPVYADSDRIIFPVPRGADEVWLLSRAQSPSEARPWLEDRRKLGVCVKRIMLRNASELREIPMDSPDLIEGWWNIERDGQMLTRWTNGEAAMRLPKMDGCIMLELRLAGEMIYVQEVERRAA